MNIPVQASPVTYTREIVQVQLVAQSISLFDKISFIVRYLDSQGSFIEHATLPQSFVIEKEEYQSWGEDDTFILTKLFTLLNQSDFSFTPLIPVDPPE